MSTLGQTINDTLELHGIDKVGFAARAGISRAQLANILSGRTRAPDCIPALFAAMRELGVPPADRAEAAAAYLRDRLHDTGTPAHLVSVETTRQPKKLSRRAAVIALYDSHPAFRSAVNSILPIVSPRI